MLENPHCKAYFRRKKSPVSSEIVKIKVEIEPETEEENNETFVNKSISCDFTENVLDENIEIKEEVLSDGTDDEEELNEIEFEADPLASTAAQF